MLQKKKKNPVWIILNSVFNNLQNEIHWKTTYPGQFNSLSNNNEKHQQESDTRTSTETLKQPTRQIKF